MDRIIRATAGDGFIKMAVITARETVQRAREIHGCSPTAAAALGRTLCGASLLGEAMKEENASLTIRVNGGGPIWTRDGRPWSTGWISSNGRESSGGAAARSTWSTFMSRSICGSCWKSRAFLIYA